MITFKVVWFSDPASDGSGFVGASALHGALHIIHGAHNTFFEWGATSTQILFSGGSKYTHKDHGGWAAKVVFEGELYQTIEQVTAIGAKFAKTAKVAGNKNLFQYPFNCFGSVDYILRSCGNLRVVANILETTDKAFLEKCRPAGVDRSVTAV